MEDHMRKLVIATLVTLDGVAEDPQSWASRYFDAEAAEHSLRRLQDADAFLMGRGSYEYFVPNWPAASGPYMDHLNAMPKYVFSSTLERAEWSNTTIVRGGDVVEAVRELKGQDGGELVMYGYGRLSQTLLEHDLVDQLEFGVHPIVLGRGTPVFRKGRTKALRLLGTEVRSSGVVSLRYGREEA
jgi:dihydrofolate reductase